MTADARIAIFSGGESRADRDRRVSHREGLTHGKGLTTDEGEDLTDCVRRGSRWKQTGAPNEREGGYQLTRDLDDVQ